MPVPEELDVVEASRVLAGREPRRQPLVALAVVVALIAIVIVLPRPAKAAPLVLTLRPDGPGQYLGWTPKGCRTNWNCVSEATPDGDTTYLLSKAFGDWDSFNLQNLRLAGTINSVTVFAVARVASGTCTENCVILGVHVPNSATYWNQNNPPFSTSYTAISVTWSFNPTNSSAWTVRDVNTLEVSIYHYVDNSQRLATVRVTQVYVEVSITPTPQIIILRPVANWVTDTWSISRGKGSNFDRVDEVVSDGDATYVYSSAADLDQYVLEDLPITGTIGYVRFFAVGRLTSGTCVNTCLVLGITTEYPGYPTYHDATYVLTGGYATYSYNYTQNRFGGGPWTVAQVNALDLAISHTIVLTPSGYDRSSTIRVTQVWAEVYITPS